MSKKTIKDILPMLFVVVIAIILTIIEKVLHLYDIEFRTYMQIIKGMIIWLLMPITIIFVIYNIRKPFLEGKKKAIRIGTRILVGILVAANLLLSGLLGLSYVFSSRMKEETMLEDGMILATYSDFLSESEKSYYKPVTVFCRKPFQGWSDEEVLTILQERYGDDISRNGFKIDETTLYEKRAEIGINVSFQVLNDYEVTENYMDRLLSSYAETYWADQERIGYIWEDPESEFTHYMIPNLIIKCENSEDIQNCAEDIADWIKFALENEDFVKYNNKLAEIYIVAGNETTNHLIRIGGGFEDYTRKQLIEDIIPKLQNYFEDQVEKPIDNTTPLDDNEVMDFSETVNFYLTLDVAEVFQLSQEITYRLVIVDSACGSKFYALIGTKDSGNSWQIINTDPFPGRGGVSAGITFLDKNLGFSVLSHSGGSYGEMYRTEDSGKTYSEIILPDVQVELQGGETYNPFVLPKLPYEKDGILYIEVGQGQDGDYQGGDSKCMGFFKSEDQGKTWIYLGE